MFLPHEVMGSIYDFDPQLFHKFFGRPEACTQRFFGHGLLLSVFSCFTMCGSNFVLNDTGDPRILPTHENVRFALVV